ncbi:MAG: OsmC family protein [Acidobacteriaceae bacterium]
MQASATWKPATNNIQEYDALASSGHTVHLDASPEHAHGPSPMELVLMALCGCASVDVVSILQKKRQPFTGLTISAVAEQAMRPPQIFTHIRLIYRISGNVSQKAMEDAVRLSKGRYCAVSQMLEKTATIEAVIEYVGNTLAESAG